MLMINRKRMKIIAKQKNKKQAIKKKRHSTKTKARREASL